MALALINQPTAANYPTDQSRTGCILGPSTLGKRLDIVVGNAPCLVSLASIMDKQAGPLAGYQWTEDIPLVAGSGQIFTTSFDDCVGFKAKDLLPGTHATVYATLWEKADPLSGGAVSYAGTISGSGVTPPAPPVTSLQVQHNDALVGSEPAIDFGDGGNVTWTVTDDVAGTRVKISASVPTIPSIPSAGTRGYVTVGDPAGSNAGVYIMEGFGSTFQVTPTKTGVVLLDFTGAVQADFTNSFASIYVAYGTPAGSAPGHGSGASGTQISQAIINIRSTGGVTNAVPYAFSLLQSGLSVGTSYWYDIVLNANVGAGGSLQAPVSNAFRWFECSP